MATKQKTVAELKDEIVAKGLYYEFKAIMISAGRQDLYNVFVLVDQHAKYAASSFKGLISFKKRSDGYQLSVDAMGHRNNTINKNGFKVTGNELLELYNLMVIFLNDGQDEEKDDPVKQNKQTPNRVAFFHYACGAKHFELDEISLQEAIEAYCDEFDLKGSAIENIQALFFNESDLKRIEKKVAYKVLD